MPVKPIVTDPSALSVVSAPVSASEIDSVITDLVDTAKANAFNCAGLSAIQIGYAAQAFVIRDGEKYHTFVNPKVKQYRGGMAPSIEGCLSFPGKSKMVRRHKEVVLEDGSMLKGHMAIVFQHEFEHLEGRTIFGNAVSVAA